MSIISQVVTFYHRDQAATDPPAYLKVDDANTPLALVVPASHPDWLAAMRVVLPHRSDVDRLDGIDFESLERHHNLAVWLRSAYVNVVDPTVPAPKLHCRDLYKEYLEWVPKYCKCQPISHLRLFWYHLQALGVCGTAGGVTGIVRKKMLLQAFRDCQQITNS
jgi:hypothetical protein